MGWGGGASWGRTPKDLPSCVIHLVHNFSATPQDHGRSDPCGGGGARGGAGEGTDPCGAVRWGGGEGVREPRRKPIVMGLAVQQHRQGVNP